MFLLFLAEQIIHYSSHRSSNNKRNVFFVVVTVSCLARAKKNLRRVTWRTRARTQTLFMRDCAIEPYAMSCGCRRRRRRRSGV